MHFLYYFFIFLFGLSIGSFINSCVWRVRENLRISQKRSICPYCRDIIAWYDNIPILSFIALKGRCRKCKKPISWQYPLAEIFVGLAFVAVAWHYQFGKGLLSPELIRDWIITAFLAFIFIYDFKYKEILDSATLIPGVFLFLFSLAMGWQTFISMLVGVAIGAGIFLFQYLVSAGEWIGGGDIRLGLFMGVILGWPNILIGLFLAYVMGAAFSILLILTRRKKIDGRVPFGTYLALATFITMLWGGSILDWYLNLIY